MQNFKSWYLMSGSADAHLFEGLHCLCAPPTPPALPLWCSTSPPLCPADWSGYDSADMSMYGLSLHQHLEAKSAPQGPGSYGDGRVSFNQLPGPSSLVS